MNPHPRNPIAARRDPGTSDEAARKITRSGKRDAQSKEVLDAVRARPGLTSAEYAGGVQSQRFMFARRLPDLEKLGLVRKGPPRPCRQTGSRCVTWWPAHDGKPQQGTLL